MRLSVPPVCSLGGEAPSRRRTLNRRPAARPPQHPRAWSRVVLVSNSAGETRALGAQLALLASGDETLALSGPLGAGKTCLVQGVGRALGIRRPISSPSFVLMKRYRGRFPLTHWDWYRLADRSDLESCGFADPQVGPGLVVIEWAERFLDQIERPFVQIEITPTGRHSRRLRFQVRGRSPRLSRFIRDLRDWWVSRHCAEHAQRPGDAQ